MNTKISPNSNISKNTSSQHISNPEKSAWKDFANIFFNSEIYKPKDNNSARSNLPKEKSVKHKEQDTSINHKNTSKDIKSEKKLYNDKTKLDEDPKEINFSPFLPPPQIENQTIKSSKMIINAVDLEKIISCIRTQMTPDGHKISLDLSRSVLDGLRINLSANKTGSIEAELIASTERSKFQIDAYIKELTSMFQLRGIDISSLTTCVNTSTQQHNGSNKNFQNQLSTIKNNEESFSVKALNLNKPSTELANEFSYSV